MPCRNNFLENKIMKIFISTAKNTQELTIGGFYIQNTPGFLHAATGTLLSPLLVSWRPDWGNMRTLAALSSALHHGGPPVNFRILLNEFLQLRFIRSGQTGHDASALALISPALPFPID
jgi:hypothetical protein